MRVYSVDPFVMLKVDPGAVDLTREQVAELRAVVNSRDVPAVVATRARIVLWKAEGRRRKDVAQLAGVSLPTVDRWLDRYAADGLAGLEDYKRGAPREQVPARIRARILALTRTSPPARTGLSHWSARLMAAHIKRTEQISVSWHYVAKLWRDNDLKPHRSGTFTLSKDPRFAEKVADVVGLYLDPPAGAVVLSSNVTFHFTPVGSSWINQIETWLGIATRQAIRRGTFSSVNALVARIRDYVEHWNTDAKPFTWTATAEQILAKVRLVQTNVKKLVANNSR